MPAYLLSKSWLGGTTRAMASFLRVKDAMAARSQQSPVESKQVQHLVLLFIDVCLYILYMLHMGRSLRASSGSQLDTLTRDAPRPSYNQPNTFS